MLTGAPSQLVRTDIPYRITVVRELPADLETPVSVYLKLAGPEPSFLLESVTGGEHLARYSFVGVNPSRAYVLRGSTLDCYGAQGELEQRREAITDPLAALRAEMARCLVRSAPGLPRFAGGLVGYLGYELAGLFEPSVPVLPAENGAALPDAILLRADTLVAFDHAFGRLLLIANAPVGVDGSIEEAEAREAQALEEGQARLDELQARLAQPLSQATEGARPAPTEAAELRSNISRSAFVAAVLRAKEYISAGDIFQVVLSQRFSRTTQAAPFNIYRSLRRLNPSPYMFYFDFAGLAGGPEPFRLIGASPEMHVRLERNEKGMPVAAVRPIAGTRPRGDSPGADRSLEQDLLADPKERAEHIMLVDLARNDLGQVCEYGSVSVPELMAIERYSHVMHIASHVEGSLRPEYDGFDLMKATFPAGTVSGAPKIRAMQIIAELEGTRRGPYAGAVGYFSYEGVLDTCITIRTLVMQGQTVHIQAGAGIVADSDPEREHEESLNKARALAMAVQMAERGA